MRRLLLVLLVVALAAPAFAQRRPTSRTSSRAALAPPRIGVGFDMWSALPGQDLIPEGVAVGLRTRVALPINADLSAAASVGLGAHLWQGSANARWVANPQTSLIVTLPARGRRSHTYILGGFGAYLPLDNRGGGAPTLHAGIGTAIPLNDTSFYVELNPSLLIGRQETSGVLAARAGIIF